MCNDNDININICGIYGVAIVMRSVAAGVNLRVGRLINVLQQIVGPFILSTLVDLTTAAVYIFRRSFSSIAVYRFT